jgi:hypothetical protein
MLSGVTLAPGASSVNASGGASLKMLIESDSRYNFSKTGSHSFSEPGKVPLVGIDLHETAATRLRHHDQRYKSAHGRCAGGLLPDAQCLR